MDAKTILEFVKTILSWPVVIAIGLLMFRNQIRSLAEGLRSLLDRINRMEAKGISVELGEALLKEATPKQIDAPADIEFNASEGAYSTDNRAIFVVAGIANRTDTPDQVVSWQLTFPSLNITLQPSPAPPNLIGGVPWWRPPNVKLPPNELVQGSLFFRGVGVLADDLPEEPLRGTITASTLHGKILSQNIEVYRMVTLQARAQAAKV